MFCKQTLKFDKSIYKTKFESNVFNEVKKVIDNYNYAINFIQVLLYLFFKLILVRL